MEQSLEKQKTGGQGARSREFGTTCYAILSGDPFGSFVSEGIGEFFTSQ
jgi:hypothetical protein